METLILEMVEREAVYRTALPRVCGVWCGTRTRIVIFEWASAAALWPGLRGMPLFRSTLFSFFIVLDGQRVVGRALQLSATPRGNGVRTLSFPFWGTYEPCRFSTREVRMDVYDWQGCINRLQNSSFFSTTIFVPARAERSLLRLSREQPKMRLAKKSNLCADP